jgi:hypothetical protein
MDEMKNILDNLLLEDVRLKEMTANIEECINCGPETVWTYEIIEHDQEKLLIQANVELKNKTWFDVKASFIISFKVLKKLEKNDISENIDDLIYFASSKYTLLTGFISDMMYGVPMSIAPYIDKKNISIAK